MSLTDELSSLDAATQAAIESVIAECRKAKTMVRRPHGENGEVYAYPKPRGGICWGYDGPPHGFNIARGVRS